MCAVHAGCAVWVTDIEAFHAVSHLILIIIEHDAFDYFCTWPGSLASLRHAYLGSFFLDPEDIRELGMGAIWNFAKGTGLL
jgi:hypothetical protein